MSPAAKAPTTLIGDDVEEEIDRALVRRRLAYLATAGGVRLAGETRARLHDIADDEADDEREGGDDLEIDQRLDADAADLLGVLDMGDAGDDRAEDDRRDHHLDQLDEAVAERLDAGRGGEVGEGDADDDAEQDGEQDLDVELAVKRLLRL